VSFLELHITYDGTSNFIANHALDDNGRCSLYENCITKRRYSHDTQFLKSVLVWILTLRVLVLGHLSLCLVVLVLDKWVLNPTLVIWRYLHCLLLTRYNVIHEIDAFDWTVNSERCIRPTTNARRRTDVIHSVTKNCSGPWSAGLLVLRWPISLSVDAVSQAVGSLRYFWPQ